jgi:F-type H+-transporting ATPase subunit b
VVIFACFWWLMKWLLFDPVQHVIELREECVEGAIRKARAVEKEAEAIEAEIARRLAEARGQGRKRAAEVRALAEAEGRAITERARKQAAELVSTARRTLVEEVRRARRELPERAEVLSSAAAAKLLGRPV